MVKYIIKRPDKQYDEADFSEDYEDYYEEHYGDYDEEYLESEKKQQNGFITSTLYSYKDKIESIKQSYRENVSLQKAYYEDKDSRWLHNQQTIRDMAFLKKLFMVIGLIIIVSVIMVLLVKL